MPDSKPPNAIFVPFSDWKDKFDLHERKTWSKRLYPDLAAVEDQIVETLDEASFLLKPHRGTVTQLDRYKSIVMFTVFIVIVLPLAFFIGFYNTSII